MNLKLIIIGIITILLLSFPSIVKAEIGNSTLILIPYTSSEQKYDFDNNIFVTYQVENNENRITDIEIRIINNDYSTNSGFIINLSNNLTYEVHTEKYTWFLIPRQNVSHKLTFLNYTIFNQSKDTLNTLQYDIISKISIDLQSGRTKFYTTQKTDFNSSLQYTSENFLGLPAEILTINGLQIFKTKITITNIGYTNAITEKKNQLTSISGFIYNILTLKIPLIEHQLLDDSENLLNLLLFIDLFFFIVYLVFAIIFIYPYLILIWIMSLINILSCYKANTTKEWISNMGNYYNTLGKAFYNIMYPLIQLVIRFVSSLINAITNLF